MAKQNRTHQGLIKRRTRNRTGIVPHETTYIERLAGKEYEVSHGSPMPTFGFETATETHSTVGKQQPRRDEHDDVKSLLLDRD